MDWNVQYIEIIIDVIQTIALVGVTLYIWLASKSAANTDHILKLDKRLTKVEESKLSTEDSNTLHARITEMGLLVSEIKGVQQMMSKQLDLLQNVHTRHTN